MRALFKTLLTSLLLSGLSFSAEFASEPFDGTASDPVNGTGSGTGWTGNWARFGGTVNSTIYATGNSFIAGGATVASSAQSAHLGGGTGAGEDMSRSLGATYTIGDDTGAGEHPLLYLSFLLENPGSVASGHEFRVTLNNGGTQVISFGKVINGQWRLIDSDETVNFTTNTGGSNVGNWLAVVKLEYVGTDTIVTGYLAEDSDAGLDPTDLSSYLKTGSTTITGKATFNQVRIRSHNTVTAKVDEIRLGDDLANIGGAADPLMVVTDPLPFTTNDAEEGLFFEVSNAGATQDLTITGITPGGTDATNIAVDTSFPLTIPAGSSDFIDFTFTPNGTYQANYSATLEFASNAASSPDTITLDITNNPDPRIDASNVNLVNNGAAASYALPVGNLGFNNDLTITGVTPGGLDAGTVVIDSTFPLTITPGSDDVIDFTFTPNLGAVPYEFNLTIDSNDPATPAKVVNVNVEIQDPVIQVAANSLDFGMLGAAPGPQVLTLTVTNGGGTQDLTIENTTGITGDAEFTLTSPALPVTIGPGLSADLEITFTPGSGAGRFSGNLEILSDDFDSPIPNIALTGFVDPAGTVVARFDFDPNNLSGTTVDLDASGMSAWDTGDLTDLATGIGALSAGNQTGANREVPIGLTGNYLRFSSNRESDAQTPLAAGGNDETTWTTFSVTPDSGGGEIDFTGGTAVVDTYANTNITGTSSTDWTLYYSTDGGTTWISLGTVTGASTTSSMEVSAPAGATWDLSTIGTTTTPVDFILDPVSTGSTNGSAGQRGTGFDNLILSAGSVTPGTAGFSSWATTNGIVANPNGDTDNDGIEELVEYALGLDPNVPDGAAGTLTGLALSFTKGAEAVANGDVTYSIETSTDLGQSDSWTAVTPDVDDANSISYTLPTGAGKIFARLVVSEL